MRYTNYKETFNKIYNIFKVRTNNNEILNDDDLEVINSLLINYFNFHGKDIYYYDYILYADYLRKDDCPPGYFAEYENNHAYGTYDYLYNYIILFFDNIISESLKKSDSIFFINLQILETYFHEFTHCMQNFYIRNNSIESIDDHYFQLQYLLHSISKHITKNDNSVYDELYELIPSERMAEIDSLKYISYMLNNFENNLKLKKDGMSYINHFLYKYYLEGYTVKEDGIISPLKAFLDTYLEKTDDNVGIIMAEEIKYLLNDCITNFKKSYRVTDEMIMYLGIDIPRYTFDFYKDMSEKARYDFCDNLYKNEQILKHKI